MQRTRLLLAVYQQVQGGRNPSYIVLQWIAPKHTRDRVTLASDFWICLNSPFINIPRLNGQHFKCNDGATLNGNGKNEKQLKNISPSLVVVAGDLLIVFYAFLRNSLILCPY